MTFALTVQILFLILFVTSVSLAQVKTLTEADYDAATNAAFYATAKKIHRSNSTHRFFDKGKIVRSSTVTEENLPPDRSRLLIVQRGSESSRMEVITIGNDIYEKQDSENWKKTRKEAAQTFTVRGNPSMDIPKTTVQYTVADSRLNGQTVRVFSKLETNLSSFENSLYNLNAGVSLKVIWVSKDGLIMKREATITDCDTKRVADKTVEIYDYQPKGIKIEAPIK